MPPGGSRRGKYLGFVAHEIKNPLATAVWSCDLLKRMNAADRAGPRAEKMLDAALRALRRMRRLVDDYFTIERLQENGYELRHDRLELRAVVDGAMAQIAEKDGIKTDGWSLDVPAHVEVSGDLEMLSRGVRMALEHLARASVEPKLSIVGRALPQGGGALLLRAEQPPSPLVPPLPEERPPGDPGGGVLGFAVAQEIVDAHAGSLDAQEGGLLLSLPDRAPPPA